MNRPALRFIAVALAAAAIGLVVGTLVSRDSDSPTPAMPSAKTSPLTQTETRPQTTVLDRSTTKPPTTIPPSPTSPTQTEELDAATNGR